jgi:hypothetical protein
MRSDSLQSIPCTFDTAAYYIEASTRIPLAVNNIIIHSVSADILLTNGSHAGNAPMGLNSVYFGFFSLPVHGWSYPLPSPLLFVMLFLGNHVTEMRYVGYNSTNCEELKINETVFTAKPDTNNNGSNGQPAFSAYPSISPTEWQSSGINSIITPTTISSLLLEITMSYYYELTRF